MGTKLQCYRTRAGLSQRALSEKLQISETTIYRWEHGHIQIPREALDKLAKLFGVAPSDIDPSLNQIPAEVTPV